MGRGLPPPRSHGPCRGKGCACLAAPRVLELGVQKVLNTNLSNEWMSGEEGGAKCLVNRKAVCRCGPRGAARCLGLDDDSGFRTCLVPALTFELMQESKVM